MNTLSQTENRDLMTQAREVLKGRWGLAIGAVVIVFLILMGVQIIPEAGGIVSFVISGPMMVGLLGFCLSISRKQEVNLAQVFDGFSKFLVSFAAYALQLIFVLLWALLLIVPGIIAAISYSMTYFIIAENESIGPLQAITRSKEMMRGNKWKFVCLNLRLFGWAILCVVTCGLGFLWLFPYLYISFAQFYDDIKPTAEELELTGTGQEIMR